MQKIFYKKYKSAYFCKNISTLKDINESLNVFYTYTPKKVVYRNILNYLGSVFINIFIDPYIEYIKYNYCYRFSFDQILLYFFKKKFLKLI